MPITDTNIAGSESIEYPGDEPRSQGRFSIVHASERAASCRADRDEAQRSLNDVDNGVSRFFVGDDSGARRDVTAEYRAQQAALVSKLDELAKAWDVIAGLS